MIRHFSLATAFVAAIALPVLAQDNRIIDPGGSTGPTDTMTDQVPQMKRDAEAIKKAGPDSATPLPSSKAVGEAVPSMLPSDAVSGQADTKSSPNAAAEASPAPGVSTTLTRQETVLLIDKPIFSSDGKKIGEVVEFQHDDNDNVIGMHADVGGFLGLGQTRVNLTPAQFKVQDDRIVLELTAEEVKDLPEVQE
jgi:hypothetical protein